MAEQHQELGGRIKLSEPAELTSSQRNLYDAIDKHMVPWAQASGFVPKLDDGRLIGPFNIVLQSPEIGAAFVQLQGVEGRSTSLDERVRQVVILTMGTVWNSAYELYAHAAVSRKAGLPDEAIAALRNGDVSSTLSQKEKLAHQFTKQLAVERTVSQELFDRAEIAFGVRGIVDILVLAGCYGIVCSLLNTFDVPAPVS